MKVAPAGPRLRDQALDSLRFDQRDGLLPAIVQHADTDAVLMLGYMNREALRASLARGRVVFFSRSRQRLWEKGETSGHTLELLAIRTDCDRDTLLVTARPTGPVCHLGTSTCFDGEAVAGKPREGLDSLAFLARLEALIAHRLALRPKGSYTAGLYEQGPLRIAQKVGEEAVEVALAAVAQSDEQLTGECADLVYHLLLLLASRGLRLADVTAELQSRQRYAAGPSR